MRRLLEEGMGAHRGSCRVMPGANCFDERPWPSSARSLVVDVGRLFARGRFPGSRVIAASLWPSPSLNDPSDLPDVLRNRSPATVAGPRRYSTCFPFTLLLWRHLERRQEDISGSDSARGGDPGKRKRARILERVFRKRGAFLLCVGAALHRVLFLEPPIEAADDGLGGNVHLLECLRRTGASVFVLSGTVGGDGLAHLLELLGHRFVDG